MTKCVLESECVCVVWQSSVRDSVVSLWLSPVVKELSGSKAQGLIILPKHTHIYTHAHTILSMLEMFENKHAHIIMHILCKCLTEREGGRRERGWIKWGQMGESQWERKLLKNK